MHPEWKEPWEAYSTSGMHFGAERLLESLNPYLLQLKESESMWRAFFSAIGIVLLILGVECLLIDSAVLAAGVVDDPMPMHNTASLFAATPPQANVNRVFRPAEWLPWSLLTSGAVVLLYAISLRRGPAS